MTGNFLRGACLAAVLSFVALPTQATVIAIDYFTGFTTPTQVITSDQPTGPISGDPGSGVTFVNPNLYHTVFGTLDNFNPASGGFGGTVTVVLPSFADAFGLFVGSNSGGAEQFMLEFFSGATSVGTGSFTMPFGNPATPIAAAYASDILFDSVVLTGTAGGFMRINEDSIRFQAAEAIPVPAALPLLATGLGLLQLLAWRRRGKASAAAA